MSWRDISNNVINRVFREQKPTTVEEAKKLLKAAYPFGERAMHPYKIWLSAVKRALKQRFGKYVAGEQMTIDEGLFSNYAGATEDKPAFAEATADKSNKQ